MDVDNNMLYVITTILYNVINLNKFFSNEKLIIMKEAIEDHRASLDRKTRSIYGKLLSSADRNIDVDDLLKRTYPYSITHFNKHSEKETIEEYYKHTLKKFGNDGYTHFFIEDINYNKYLKELHCLLNNKGKFTERLKETITKIK